MKYKKKYTDSKLHEQKGGAISDRVYFMDKERLLAYINSYHGQLADNIYKEPVYIDAIETLKTLTDFYFPSETNPTTPQPKPPTEIPDKVKEQVGKNGDVAVLNADGTIDDHSTKQVIKNIESSKLVKANEMKKPEVTQTVRNDILEDAIKSATVTELSTKLSTELSTEVAEENSEYLQKSWWSRAWNGFISGCNYVINGFGVAVCSVWDGAKWVFKYVTYGIAYATIKFGTDVGNALITVGAVLRLIFKVINPTRVFNPISDFQKEHEHKLYEIVKNTVWFGEDNCVKLITPDLIQRCALQIKDYGINVTGRGKGKINQHEHNETDNQREYDRVKAEAKAKRGVFNRTTWASYEGLPSFINESLYDETLYNNAKSEGKIDTLKEYITYDYEIKTSAPMIDIDKYTFDDNIGNIREDTKASSKMSNLQRLVVNKSICALLSIQNAPDNTDKNKSDLKMEDRKKIKYAVYIDVDPSGRNANVIKWIIKLNESKSCSVMIGPQFRGYDGKITTNYDTNYDSTHWKFVSILDGLSHQHLFTWNESARAFIETVDPNK